MNYSNKIAPQTYFSNDLSLLKYRQRLLNNPMSKNIWNKQFARGVFFTKAVYNGVFIITGKKDAKEKKIKTCSS